MIANRIAILAKIKTLAINVIMDFIYLILIASNAHLHALHAHLQVLANHVLLDINLLDKAARPAHLAVLLVQELPVLLA